MFLEKQYQLGEEVTASFTVVIDEVLLGALKSTIATQPELQEAQKACITPQDLIRILPEQCFCPCLKQVKALP